MIVGIAICIASVLVAVVAVAAVAAVAAVGSYILKELDDE